MKIPFKSLIVDLNGFFRFKYLLSQKDKFKKLDHTRALLIIGMACQEVEEQGGQIEIL